MFRYLFCFLWLGIMAGQPASAAPLDIVVTRGLTLAEALRLADTQSPVIAAAEAAVSAAEGGAMQAGLRPNPEARAEIENFSGGKPYDSFDGAESTLAVSQRLELGNKRSSRRQAAGANVEAAKLRLAIARADTARDVRDGFAHALAARDRLSLALANKERATELARVTDVLVDAGREPPLRALRASAMLAEAATEHDMAQVEYDASRRALASLWGADDVGDLVVQETVPPDTKGRPGGDTLDVRLALAERLAAERAVVREKAAGRPDVTAELGVRRFEESGSEAAIFGLSVPIPVSDRNQGNVASARAEVAAAEAHLVQAIALNDRLLRDAQSRFKAADARMKALQGAALRSADAMKLASKGFEAGKFSLLDVFDAQTAHATTQSGLIEARLQRGLAESALLRVTAQ